MKHTPAPWDINTLAGPQLREVFAGDVLICDCGATNVEMEDIEIEANARLIAAAPELLTELRHLVSLLEPLENDGTLHVPGIATLNGAREAIRKAEG